MKSLLGKQYEECIKNKLDYLQQLQLNCFRYSIRGDDYFSGLQSISDGSLTISSIKVPQNFSLVLFVAERQQRTSNYDYEQMDYLINGRTFAEVFSPN